ncbi:MAG: hypothetical protein WKF61_00660 [Luteimonas sp.]
MSFGQAQRLHDNQAEPVDNDGKRSDEWLTDIAIEQPATFNEWVGEWLYVTTELRGGLVRTFHKSGHGLDVVIAVNLTDSLHAYIREHYWPAARAELQRLDDRMSDQ